MAEAASSTLISFQEFIGRLSVSPRTGHRMLARGDVACVHVGRLIRISEAALEDYLEGRVLAEASR
jgi:excisionase family DNA binding protein